ncbi:hypothetical protein DFS33DRAFT_1280473 [Desarmillaria ectypa]|nr:hypothetical protein DFS33DRAFT_1280473 [Desarmillaria ectypa]
MSLASRAFYPRTRLHLFREVDLYDDDTAKKFAALCHTFPSISPLVVSLGAVSCWCDGEDSWILFPSLPSLRHLTVQEVWEGSFRVPLALSSHNQSYISAMFWHVQGFSKILELIGGSFELQHLALLSLGSPETLPAQYAEFQKYILFEGRRLRPESFAIEYPFDELYDILLSPESVISFERLRVFAISIATGLDLDFAVTVINATVNTLKILRIQFDKCKCTQLLPFSCITLDSDTGPPIWPDDFTLSHIRAIDIIAFDCDEADYGSSDDLDCWMIDCLTREVNLLEKATIRIATRFMNTDLPTLSGWDDVLTGELMSSFRLLTIQVVHGHDVLDPSLAGIFKSKVEGHFRGWLNVEFKVYIDIDMLNMLSIYP